MGKILISTEAAIAQGLVIDKFAHVKLRSGMIISDNELSMVAHVAVKSARKQCLAGVLLALDKPEVVVEEARNLRADFVSGRRVFKND